MSILALKTYIKKQTKKQLLNFRIMKTSVENMTSSNGNKIANQFIIRTGKSTIFQSYNSTIVKRTNKNVYLDSYYWDYSKTTSKYRNMFLGETSKETQQKIDNGIYKLTNLN